MKEKRYLKYFTKVKPILSSPVIKTYGSPILTVAALTIFILFAIKPTIETILVLQKQVANSKIVLEKIVEKEKALTEGKKNYDAIDQNSKDKINSFVPDTPQIKSIVSSLESSALKNQASISALQLDSVALSTDLKSNAEKLNAVKFTFNVAGSYQEILSVLEDMQKSSRLFSIQRVNIGQINGSKDLIMSVAGEVYYVN